MRRGALVLGAAAMLSAAGWCRAAEACRTGARALFLEVERAARGDEAAQRECVAHLYYNIYPQLAGCLAHLVPYQIPASGELSAEQLAARIEQEAGWGWLAEAARRRAHEILARQRNAVRPLVRADFQDGSPKSLLRALRTVGELRLWDFLDETAHVLRTAAGDLADRAADALRDLNDPRAIAPLIEKDPQRPTRYLETLRVLQRNRPPHPLLLRLLESADETTRRQAAYALADSIRPK